MTYEVAGFRTPQGNAPAAPPSPQIGLPFVFDVVRRWWSRLLVAGLILGGASAAIGYVLWSPTYEAEAVLVVNPSLVFSQDHFDSLQFSRSQLEVIKSPAVLEPAIQDEKVQRLLAARRVADPLGWVRKRLTATVMGESQLFVVKVKAEDPE